MPRSALLCPEIKILAVVGNLGLEIGMLRAKQQGCCKNEFCNSPFFSMSKKHPRSRKSSCFSLPSAIGRHDARLLRLLPPSSARCISGVCAAKRFRMRKRMQCGAASCKLCRGIVPYRRQGLQGPGRGPAGFRPFPPVERAPPEAERAESAERRDQLGSASGYGSTQMGQYTTRRFKRTGGFYAAAKG